MKKPTGGCCLLKDRARFGRRLERVSPDSALPPASRGIVKTLDRIWHINNMKNCVFFFPACSQKWFSHTKGPVKPGTPRLPICSWLLMLNSTSVCQLTNTTLKCINFNSYRFKHFSLITSSLYFVHLRITVTQSCHLQSSRTRPVLPSWEKSWRWWFQYLGAIWLCFLSV